MKHKTAIAVAILVLSALSATAVMAQVVVDFSFTGSVQTWTVPAGVTSISIDAGGAQGGDDASIDVRARALGGRVVATMAVSGGQTLNIFVGGAGGNGSTPAPTAAAGGYNGGGTAGWWPLSSGFSGGGGGGATDIRVAGVALTDRILVAGGGGGSGFTTLGPKAGGAGGGTTGASGATDSGISAATGGTQVAGGAGSISFAGQPNGSAGAAGVGGNASPDNGVAGGGGGGYYGGGGGGTTGAGPGSGGGGGSSYAQPTLTLVTHTQGYNAGNGYVRITYTPITAQTIDFTSTAPATAVVGGAT